MKNKKANYAPEEVITWIIYISIAAVAGVAIYMIVKGVIS